MGYLCLALALAAGLAKGGCGKSVSRDVKSLGDCLLVNLIRLFFCAAVGLVMLIAAGSSPRLDWSALPLYLFAGFCMSLFCVCWMFAYRTEAYLFLNVFSMLGTVITCLFDTLIYKTALTGFDLLGIALLLCAVWILSLYSKSLKGKLTKKGIVILVLGCLGSAGADFSQKMYVRSVGGDAATFNFWLYLAGTVLLAAAFLLALGNKSRPPLTRILTDGRHIGICFAIAFFLYVNSAAKTAAAAILPSAQIYPVLQGANLILSALMAQIFFGERITKKSALGMVIAFAGVMILNFL